MNEIRLSLLHLALKPGEMPANYALVERGIRVAAASGAHCVVAPELCISGYEFTDVIGTDWIALHPDKWTIYICQLAQLLHLAIVFGHVERDAEGKLYNCALMVDETGVVIGHHRKINTSPEPWSSPGQVVEPTNWNGLNIGMLICADAYTKEIAGTLRSKGAQLLVSPAAWAPGLNGPEGEWEQRTVETGLPLIVCNRTGREKSLTFCGAESLVIQHGMRLLSHCSESSAVLTFELNLERMLPASREFQTFYL
jgi:predicted amidohydrolase